LHAAARIVAMHARLQFSQSPEQSSHDDQHQDKAANHPKQVSAS